MKSFLLWLFLQTFSCLEEHTHIARAEVDFPSHFLMSSVLLTIKAQVALSVSSLSSRGLLAPNSRDFVLYWQGTGHFLADFSKFVQSLGQSPQPRCVSRWSLYCWHWVVTWSTVCFSFSGHECQLVGVWQWHALYKLLPHGLCALDLIWIYRRLLVIWISVHYSITSDSCTGYLFSMAFCLLGCTTRLSLRWYLIPSLLHDRSHLQRLRVCLLPNSLFNAHIPWQRSQLLGSTTI